MDERTLENRCLLTAVSLLDGEIDDETRVADLYLTNDGETWDVHKRDTKGGTELMVFLDTIRPDAYPSARILGAYLRELHGIDATAVDLPDSPSEYVGPANL